jgi:hypothetical protein
MSARDNILDGLRACLSHERSRVQELERHVEYLQTCLEVVTMERDWLLATYRPRLLEELCRWDGVELADGGGPVGVSVV